MTCFANRQVEIPPDDVRKILAQSILADGLDLVLDLKKSNGSTLVDARDGTLYLDMFTFYGSSALGMNHPDIVDDPLFQAELLTAAANKPSNSDVYSVAFARFINTFAHVLGDRRLPHLFFVEGGALAVENALKVAFDWKSRWNEAHGIDPSLGTRVLHLTDAFHGRSGYTLSLTNTNPVKTARFPKFDWPRLPAPYLRPGEDVVAAENATLELARQAFERYRNEIACFIMEPIQGEGGDHHFRPEFLQRMRELCHEFDALFVLDEVQTGGGLTGTAWAYQQLGVEPDIVAFAKKVQVGGVMAGGRVDEVPENVFTTSSRIGSTWGGGLVDMVRSRRILEVIERDELIARAAYLGGHLRSALHTVAKRHTVMTDVRGRGLMNAFSLPTADMRNRVLAELQETEYVLLLGSGKRTVRFRPALTVTESELDAAVEAVGRVLARNTEAC